MQFILYQSVLLIMFSNSTLFNLKYSYFFRLWIGLRKAWLYWKKRNKKPSSSLVSVFQAWSEDHLWPNVQFNSWKAGTDQTFIIHIHLPPCAKPSHSQDQLVLIKSRSGLETNAAGSATQGLDPRLPRESSVLAMDSKTVPCFVQLTWVHTCKLIVYIFAITCIWTVYHLLWLLSNMKCYCIRLAWHEMLH